MISVVILAYNEKGALASLLITARVLQDHPDEVKYIIAQFRRSVLS